MGRLFLVNLEGKSYSCKHCKTNLALCDDVVAKSFHTRHGKASLFSKVVNVYARKKEDRMMMLKRLSRRTNPSHQPKDYIHVRARRGQATDRHSLAERARREKISEKMTALQDIFRKRKALVLDEIINYIQSLQRQVEFLSMKLEVVNSGASTGPTIGVFPSRDLGTLPIDVHRTIYEQQ